MISATASPSSSRTCAASVGLIRPKRLADGAATPLIAWRPPTGLRVGAQQAKRDRMRRYANTDRLLAAGHRVRNLRRALENQRQRPPARRLRQDPRRPAEYRSPSGQDKPRRRGARSVDDRRGRPLAAKILATASGLAASAPRP